MAVAHPRYVPRSREELEADRLELIHIRHQHVGQLPVAFTPDWGVTWGMVHRLLHRLFRWKNWTHTER